MYGLAWKKLFSCKANLAPLLMKSLFAKTAEHQLSETKQQLLTSESSSSAFTFSIESIKQHQVLHEIDNYDTDTAFS